MPMPVPPSRRAALRIAAVALLTAAALSTAGCTQVADAFNSLGSETEATPAPVASPGSATPDMPFDSQFTYDGSVSLSYDVADQLELRLDVWAAEPKRTHEWYTDGEKTFGFAVNVYDHLVDEKAVLTQKRRVYISNVSISSQTAQTSNQTSNPFQFSADPRTLVPTDTLRSDRGLLLNSYQGGLHVPQTVIRQLPPDTYGLTLQFALDVWVEGTANTDTSFAQQTVYPVLPIAISSPDGGEAAP